MQELKQLFTASKDAAWILRAANNKLRQQIMIYLFDYVSVTVTEAYITLRMEQSVMSQQLAILREAGLVKCERSGKEIRYSLCMDTVTFMLKHAKELSTIKPVERV